jgi:predicted metal-dependent phosphoesterase TrpH
VTIAADAPDRAADPLAEPLARHGRADLHVHTLASDGTSSVAEILAHVAAAGQLDVMAITDHERIDAAVAARHMAQDAGLPFEVVVGEEITTRGGHLLGLFLERPVPALKSLRWSIEAVHDQGGLAVPAHPLVPYPLCAQGPLLRRLLASDDERVHPDALETFNPTALGRYRHDAVVAFAERHGLAQLGNSDAHVAASIGTCWTTFPGSTPADLRAAIEARETIHHGAFHDSIGQLGVFGRQLRKYSRDWRADIGGRVRRDGTGRDHGYPGGTQRPPRYDPAGRKGAGT